MNNSLFSLFKKDSGTMNEIPKKIGSYSFVKELHKEKTPKPYSYAVYKTTTGGKVFAKIWTGKTNVKNYYSLKNEIKAYKFILKKMKANKGLMENYPTIQIPKLIKIVEKKDNLILLLEYVNGKTLENETNSTKIAVFKEVFNFFLHFNQTSNLKTAKQMFPNRNLKYWLILLPYISLKSMVINSKNAWLILKANILIVKNLGFKNKNNFIHRDIGESNILLNKKGVWLYDFQLSCFSDQILEYAVTSVKISRDKKLFDKFNKLMHNSFLRNDQAKRKYLVFSIIFFLYEISIANKKDSEIPSRDLRRYLSLS